MTARTNASSIKIPDGVSKSEAQIVAWECQSKYSFCLTSDRSGGVNRAALMKVALGRDKTFSSCKQSKVFEKNGNIKILGCEQLNKRLMKCIRDGLDKKMKK